MSRFPHLRLALLLAAPAAVFAQPLNPTASRYPIAHAFSAPAVAAADSVALSVNTASREEVRQFYRAIYSASENVPMGWTGDYTTGNAGDTSSAYKEATRLRINFFRALVGVPAAVTLNSTYSGKDQQAALMMSANGTLQHTGIPTSWTFYTAAGADAAANSNLALGSAGPAAINGYMSDAGSNNAPVGHRRWLQYPQTREMGTGDVPGNSSYYSANATWVIDSQFGATRPATRATQISYPPAGYVPYSLVWPRWSFSYPGADFSSATVAMTKGGQSVPVTLEPLSNGIGEPTLVWVYNGLGTDDPTPHPKPSADTTYTVTVSNVRIGGVSQNFTYNVIVFDPDVAGSDASTVSISGSATPSVGSGNVYTASIPSFASSFDWRTLQVGTYSKTYGAESGLEGITAVTTSGYAVTQNGVIGAGGASFHLAQPSPPTDQILTLPETFLVTSDTATVSFLSRLGFATTTQIAHLEVSADDGVSWTDAYLQAGTGGAGEGSFVTRNASLAAYRNRTVQVRFRYSSTGTYYPQTSNGVGWYFDNIAVTGVQSVTSAATTRVSGGSAFVLTPAATGAITLQARGVLFGAYPLEWGPAASVTAVPGGSGGSSYLSNLSVRTAAGTGSQTLIVGFSVSGGTKPLLIRGIGPTLAAYGVTGVLANPKLELYSNQTNAKLQENDDWEASADATFKAVSAFSLPSGSKDAALITSVASGSYSAQLTGQGGTGVALVELYDTAGGAGGRLINVSARTQVGSGGEILIAGFSITGSGSRTLLIRAVGPTLANYGVGGVLANPKLELYSNQTNAKLQENDDWGGSTAIANAATSVYAFPLSGSSKDSALLVTLSEGTYSAQVSGVGGTTGVALVEVYELP